MDYLKTHHVQTDRIAGTAKVNDNKRCNAIDAHAKLGGLHASLRGSADRRELQLEVHGRTAGAFQGNAEDSNGLQQGMFASSRGSR